jgi:DNA helicase HerA-like ATPase
MLDLLPRLANRHGLITGATGTGKTVTLQKLAESFANIGVPVFVADIKGDLSGIGAAGNQVRQAGCSAWPQSASTEYTPRANTVVFWDVFGEQGHPVRATISDMGPLLIARLLNLNDTQTGVLTLVFKVADDNGMLLLDLKDLRAMVQYVGENAKSFTTEYGNISSRLDRRHPAQPAGARRAGRRRVLRRADARHRRPDADRAPTAAA